MEVVFNNLKLTPFISLVALIVGIVSCTTMVPIDVIRVSNEPAIIARGESLVRGIAACGACHGETNSPDAALSGGRVISDRFGEITVPNITPAASGIGKWSNREIMRAIRNSEGRIEGGEKRDLSLEVHDGYEWMSESDTLAIVSYLRTIPPVQKEIERRELSFIQRNTTGFFQSRGAEVGYVPEIDSRFEAAYGGYLVDNVARCGRCHNSEEGFFGGIEYLSGGRMLSQGNSPVTVPGIQNFEGIGIGQWNEDDIVTYLRSGKTPHESAHTLGLCPVSFYKTAAERDLRSIAGYLKSMPTGK